MKHFLFYKFHRHTDYQSEILNEQTSEMSILRLSKPIEVMNALTSRWPKSKRTDFTTEGISMTDGKAKWNHVDLYYDRPHLIRILGHGEGIANMLSNILPMDDHLQISKILGKNKIYDVDIDMTDKTVKVYKRDSRRGDDYEEHLFEKCYSPVQPKDMDEIVDELFAETDNELSSMETAQILSDNETATTAEDIFGDSDSDDDVPIQCLLNRKLKNGPTGRVFRRTASGQMIRIK